MTVATTKGAFAPKTREKIYSFNRFSVGGTGGAGTLVSRDTKNCDCADGVLRCGVGLRDYAVFEGGIGMPANLPEVDEFFPYANGTSLRKRGFMSTNGTPYHYDEDNAVWVKEDSFFTETKAVTTVDKTGAFHTFYIGGAGVFRQTQSGRSFCEVESALPVACAFMGRLFFALDGRTLAYSSAYEPYDLSESLHGGGRIVLPSDKGEIVALIPFSGEIYIFYERGVSVLTASGSPRAFSVSAMEYHGGKIFSRSVASGNDGIFFLAEDGFYKYKKSGVERVGENLGFSKRPTRVRGKAVFNGKYICSFSTEDGGIRTLVVDGKSGKGYDTFTVEGLSEYRSSVLCVSALTLREFCENGEMPQDGEKRKFAFTEPFGAGMKTLKRLSFTGKGKVTLGVSNGRKNKLFALDFSRNASAKIYLRGREFSVFLQLEQGAEIRSMTAITEQLQGVAYDD